MKEKIYNLLKNNLNTKKRKNTHKNNKNIVQNMQ
jgi:hypothetical protein